jgi:hypothetical protein
MRIIGGLISQKPLGGVVSGNSSFTQAQIKAEEKAAERQAQVDALAAKLAEKHQSAQNAPSATSTPEKRWSVKY